MKNIFTFVIESWIGAVLLGAMSISFIIMLFISMSNFNSDVDILSSNYSSLNTQKTSFISPLEKTLMNSWLGENGLKIPEGRGYNYLLEEYPDRPWLKLVE